MIRSARTQLFRSLTATLSLIILTAPFSANAQAPKRGQTADLILHNGFVWTVAGQNRVARAVAVRGDRFVAVGSDRAVLKHRGPRTRVIDLAGRFVVPGFNDNHVHFASAAQFLEFNIMTTRTQADFVGAFAK